MTGRCSDCAAISEPVAACPCHGRIVCHDCATAHAGILNCPGCDLPMAAEGLWQCDVDDAPFCRDCVPTCDGCGRVLCPGCHVRGVCEDCRHRVAGFLS